MTVPKTAPKNPRSKTQTKKLPSKSSPPPNPQPKTKPKPKVPSLSSQELHCRSELKRISAEIRTYCSLPNVAVVLKTLCERVPESLPNYRAWNCTVEVPEVIHKLIQAPEHVEDLVPTLRMMMGENIQNIPWASGIIVGMTVFRAVSDIARMELARQLRGAIKGDST